MAEEKTEAGKEKMNPKEEAPLAQKYQPQAPALKAVSGNKFLLAVLGAAALGFVAYSGNLYGVRTKTGELTDQVQYRAELIAAANDFSGERTAEKLYILMEKAVDQEISGESTEISAKVEGVIGMLGKYRDQGLTSEEKKTRTQLYFQGMKPEDQAQFLSGLDEKSKVVVRDLIETSMGEEQLLNRSIDFLLEANPEARKSAFGLLYERLDKADQESFVRTQATSYNLETIGSAQKKLFEGFMDGVNNYCHSNSWSLAKQMWSIREDAKKYCQARINQ